LSSDKTNDLDYDAELSIVRETGFLQILVKGTTVSLPERLPYNSAKTSEYNLSAEL